MKLLIVSPHCDDELIGCFSFLYHSVKNPKAKVLICYCTKDKARQKESLELKKNLSMFIDKPKLATVTQIFFSEKLIDLKITKLLLETTPNIVLVPDPYFEVHPLHRFLGCFVTNFWKDFLQQKTSLIYYSTNMSTPYLFELPPKLRESKELLLNLVYPSQRSLWEFEKKYIIFESYQEIVQRWETRFREG